MMALANVAPTFAAFVQVSDGFYEGPTMTVEEFRKLDLTKVAGGSHA